MACPLCGTRKARRHCPALDRQICTVCCGTKRLTEIKCPAGCVYLASAREHPPAVVQRQQQRDLSILLPTLQPLTEPQTRLFFLTASVITRFQPDALQRVLDEDVAAAAAALAATFETAQRGVIYEHRADSLVAQRLAAELKSVYADFTAKGGTRFERDAAATLRAIEQGARGAGAPAASTAYVELLRRFIGDAEASARAQGEGRSETGLIVPGTA
jgi:hypothetical protein